MTSTYTPPFEVVERLMAAVQIACQTRPWLLKKRYEHDPARLTGFCYIAAEALHYLLQEIGVESKPMFVNVNGEPHWFLTLADGKLLDPTWMQFGAYGTIPYTDAVGKGFLTKHPSKRAAELIKAAQTIISEVLTND